MIGLGHTSEKPDIKNLILTKNLKIYKNVIFRDVNQKDVNLHNLKIFPINIGQENLAKSASFFKDLNIKNLDIYLDSPVTLAKKFSLRGVPTTIFFNKEGKEFARIIGSIDFNDKEFIDWLKSYN